MSFFNNPPANASEEAIGRAVEVVTLSAEEAAVARTMQARLLGGEAGAAPATGVVTRRSILDLARSILQSRRRRTEHFGPVLFSEPAWDMLLVLFVYGDNGERLSVTRLADFIGAPLTTAIRWLDYLESQRLVERRQCEHDRRKFFVELSAKGDGMLRSYFENLLTTLPPLSDIKQDG